MLICKTPKKRGTKFECGECGLCWKAEFDAMQCCGKFIEHEVKMPDYVNHPPHYQGKVECIDAIETATAGLEGIEAVCTANALKYLWRWKKKNGIEDLRKAHWYIERLIGKLDAD